MTLIALLLLYPTPWLHPWVPDDTIPGDRVLTRAVAPVIGDQRPAGFSGDPAGEAEYAVEDRGDDDGAIFLLGWPALARRCRRDDLSSHPRSLPETFSPFARSPHLRC